MKDSILYYHWTSYEAIDKIKHEGLVPMNGHHCKRIHHKGSDVVYLCKKEDIEFWRKCFYDSDVLIEIETTYIKDNIKRRSLSNCPSKYEYGHFGIISPKYFNKIIDVYRGNRDELKERYNKSWDTVWKRYKGDII